MEILKKKLTMFYYFHAFTRVLFQHVAKFHKVKFGNSLRCFKCSLISIEDD